MYAKSNYLTGYSIHKLHTSFVYNQDLLKPSKHESDFYRLYYSRKRTDTVGEPKLISFPLGFYFLL
jgi:hypothetical protein